MMFTAIICVEVILFVIWFVYKIVCMMLKHKVLTSIIIIGALYLMISGHSNNVVNTNSQKNNILVNTAHSDSSIASGSSDVSLWAGSQSVLYPGDNCYETGADGHRITLHNNENTIDPTYQQMVNFIKSDQTDKIPYNYSSFECTDFAERVHNNAEAAGYKCAWVDINFVNNGAVHACNAFNTVDRGLVFIDCTNCGNRDNDKIVDLKVGKGYKPEGIGDCCYIYYSMGIVKNYQIYW
jgi:hypothetical protein